MSLTSFGMRPTNLPLLLAYAMLALGIALFLLTVVVWLRLSVEVPVRDTLTILPLVQSGVLEGWGSISLQEWLEPISNGSHRIVVTRLLMLADYTFLDGKNHAIYASTLLSLLALPYIYLKAAGLQLSQDRAGRCLVVGLALTYLCNPTQFLNLVNPINASWYVVVATSAAGVLIVLSAGKNLNIAQVLIVCLLAALAAFSNFAGVLAVSALCLLALVQRSALSTVLAILLACIVLFYFQGAESTHSSPPGSQAQAIDTEADLRRFNRLATQLGSPTLWPLIFEKVTRSVVLHLGFPFSVSHPYVASATVLGSMVLLVYWWFLAGYGVFSGRRHVPRSMQFCLSMATISIAIFCAVSLGRHNSFSPTAYRFQTLVMLYWLSISCAALLWALRQDAGEKWRQFILAAACTPPILLCWPPSPAITLAAALSNEGNQAQVLGQLGVNPFTNRQSWGAAWYASLIQEHQEFLEDYGYQLPYPDQIRFMNPRVRQSLCNGYWLKSDPSNWTGVQEIWLKPRGIIGNPFIRRLDLLGDDGDRGRLYPTASGRLEARAMFLDKRSWRGFYRGEIGTASSITLIARPLIGEDFQCVLSTQEP